KLTGHLSWAGPLMKLDFSTLTGKMVLSAEKGQFLQVDPGIGKLLGILSLQSLPSRFALDFHDIFSHGFAFDTIQSNLDVVRGVIHSDDFRMYGPSALVLMNGQTDLDHETQQIDVHVIPNVGNSISIGAAFLGGPVVGLTSLLLQKLLQDPLGRIVSYHYLITGNWDKPIVEKVSAAKASRASGEMH
ncbi:MAG TPA: AsmA-like C-terminal region-containing protein, partial [Burkholderiales bacterium]|nr:AsmA-like C-terminal region-containing protein [Burkholderiales bacterium]